MSWYKGLLAGFDLETTGLDGSKDHIVQYSVQLATADGERLIDETSYVNPGVPVKLTEIHGVTDEMVKDALYEEVALLAICSLMRKFVQHNVAVCAMNASFDFTFLKKRCEALADPTVTDPMHSINFVDGVNVIDPLVLDRQMDKYRPGLRTLEALCKIYGVDGEGFHDAGEDVRNTIAVSRAIGDKFGLDASIERVHQWQEHWHRRWVDGLREYWKRKQDVRWMDVKYGWPVQDDS